MGLARGSAGRWIALLATGLYACGDPPGSEEKASAQPKRTTTQASAGQVMHGTGSPQHGPTAAAGKFAPAVTAAPAENPPATTSQAEAAVPPALSTHVGAAQPATADGAATGVSTPGSGDVKPPCNDEATPSAASLASAAKSAGDAILMTPCPSPTPVDGLAADHPIATAAAGADRLATERAQLLIYMQEVEASAHAPEHRGGGGDGVGHHLRADFVALERWAGQLAERCWGLRLPPADINPCLALEDIARVYQLAQTASEWAAFLRDACGLVLTCQRDASGQLLSLQPARTGRPVVRVPLARLAGPLAQFLDEIDVVAAESLEPLPRLAFLGFHLRPALKACLALPEG